MGTVIATRSEMRAAHAQPPRGAAGRASWIAASDPEARGGHALFQGLLGARASNES